MTSVPPPSSPDRPTAAGAEPTPPPAPTTLPPPVLPPGPAGTPGGILSYIPPTGMRWGLSDAATGLAIFLTAVGLVAVAGTVIPPRFGDAAGFAFNLLAYGILAGTALRASRRKGLGTLAADFGFRLRWIDLVIGLAIGVAAKSLVVAYIHVAAAITGRSPEGSNLTLSTDTLWVVINGVLFASLIAPVVEELFMRGVLLRSIRNSILRGWLGRRAQPAGRRVQAVAVVLSIAGSSLVFMLLHLWQSTDPALLIVLGLSTLTLGVFNGAAAIATGRLGAPIVAHIAFNGSSVLLLLVGGQG